MSGPKDEQKDLARRRIAAHLEQWKHNRSFLQDISPQFPDWMVTTALYLTIHVVEALLTADGAKDRSAHKDRLQILEAEPRYLKILKPYHVLYEFAHVARYSADPKRWIPPGKIEDQIVKSLVYPIENSARNLLAKSSPPVELPQLGDICLKSATPAIAMPLPVGSTSPPKSNP